MNQYLLPCCHSSNFSAFFIELIFQIVSLKRLLINLNFILRFLLIIFTCIRIYFDLNAFFRVTLCKLNNRRLHQCSPFRYIANEIELNAQGICTNLGVAPLSEFEMFLMHLAIIELNYRQKLAEDWKKKCVIDTVKQYHRNYWFTPKIHEHCNDVAFNCVF